MKLNLGRLFLILFILYASQVFAQDYRWSASVNKTKAFVNEAIYLKYVCEFSDEGNLYTIGFNPLKKRDKYELVLLKETQKVINFKRINIFEYVAFVKEEGVVNFNFDIVMKKTTIDSINDLSGGLDNDKANEGFTSEFLKQKTLSVDVKNNIPLVGSFSVELKEDDIEKKAYEPYHLEISIKGIGNLKDIKEFEFDIQDVKVFSQKPILKSVITKDGYSGTWSQKFAFIGKKDFMIPIVKVDYLNLLTKEKGELSSKEINVKVTKVYEKEKLLDKKSEVFKFSYEFIYYILTFIVGFILSKIKFKDKKNKDKKILEFEEKVKKVKSLEELQIMLIMHNLSSHKELIDKIQNNEITSLTKAKKILL